jgi:hypothetical protein
VRSSSWQSALGTASLLCACAGQAAREPAPPLAPPPDGFDTATRAQQPPDEGRGFAADAGKGAVTRSRGNEETGEAGRDCPSMRAVATTDARTICHAGTLPASAADVLLSLDPIAPTLTAGGTMSLAVHVENRSARTLQLVVEHLSLVVKRDRAVVFPPPAAPVLRCRAVDCTVPSPTASLLPGGILEDEILWEARRVAWPRPEQAPCCGTGSVSPVPGAPLPPGIYALEVSVTLAKQGGGSLTSTKTAGVQITPPL